MKTSRITKLATAMTLAAATVLLAGCSPAGSADSDDKSITVWTLENQPDRVEIQKDIVASFTKETGVDVDLVAVDEGQIAQLIASSAISGELPDVMGAISLSLTRQFDSQELLDHDAAAAIVKKLGADTFAQAALELNQDDGEQISVPDSAYAQILVYRKDLFEKAGLAPPTSYENLQKAAAALTTDGQYGITLATDPADVFTSQTFESLALANDCQLVNESGDITLDSDECAQTWDLYGSLAENSPSGTQTVDTTRASYFAGQAAMVDWSTYILDELAGLRNDALPTCPECEADPEWLAKNSGIVTSISGANGETGGTYGEATSWSVTKNANVSGASQFIEYMLSDGYVDWLAMAPEGKFPLRHGDATDAQKFTDGWLNLQAGVDTKKKLSEVYDAETMTALQAVPASINRWAIPQGHGSLLGPVNTQLPIPKAIADFASGAVSPDEAAATATEAVKQLQSDLK